MKWDYKKNITTREGGKKAAIVAHYLNVYLDQINGPVL
jgi:hypothetical protein